MRGRSNVVDPTRVRLSDHFLLSDFMGCHSAYSKGLKNLFVGGDSAVAEGRHLCETLLEEILEAYGPLSISYGYISPDLSRRIVTYQDPDKPSYHRWDKGAAADICVHSEIRSAPPIALAHEIDETLGYSRMITYSESPFICVATQLDEGDQPRRAFYENRYLGPKTKPLFVKKSPNRKTRKQQGQDLILETDWVGAGYPTYHGGGIKQYQHNRTSHFSMASDFLYSTHALREGVPNAPDLRRYAEAFRQAGKTYDALLGALNIPRLSIVRGFESFRFNDFPLFNWKDHFAIDCIPPTYIRPGDVADAALALPYVNTVACDNTKGVVRIIGKPIWEE